MGGFLHKWYQEIVLKERKKKITCIFPLAKVWWRLGDRRARRRRRNGKKKP